MLRRAAYAAAGLVMLLALGGCASVASTESPGTPAVPVTSVMSSSPPLPTAVSTGATCGSVGTHDFSTTTALYGADPGALPCLRQAVARCASASLEIWQTAVDVGIDYRLTITGPDSNGCDAQLAASGFGPGPTSPDPTPSTDDCTAQINGAAVFLTCPDASYVLPSTVAGPGPVESFTPSDGTPPPALSSTFAKPTYKGPTSYPTGDNAQVLAVTTDAGGHPVLTLLMPRMYCPSMFYGIAAVPAPTAGPCVVSFDAGTGNVGPGRSTTPGTTATCPPWPTPHVTFVLDPPPNTGCTPDLSPVRGLRPGAIGWLVEGGGVPYFVLADGTEIHPPTTTKPTAPATPSTAPTP